MTINQTLNYLLAKRSEILLPFSAQLAGVSTYIKGAGGEAAIGWPLPKGGFIRRVQVWDGSSLRSATGEIAVSAGDVIGLYALAGSSDFTFKVRKNGVDTTITTSGVSFGAQVTATIQLMLE